MNAPTLDDHRTDQLRTFLTVEAAADLVAAEPAPTGARHGGRRLVAAGFAALLLGGALFAASAVSGGSSGVPGVGEPEAAAAAVTFEPQGDGWTTIRLADIDADPQAVVDALEAKGYAASFDVMDGVSLDDEGKLSSFEGLQAEVEGRGDLTVIGLGEGDGPGERGLAGLGIDLPADVEAPAFETGTAPTDGALAEMERAWEDVGVRMHSDGSVDIRDDADIALVVLVSE